GRSSGSCQTCVPSHPHGADSGVRSYRSFPQTGREAVGGSIYSYGDSAGFSPDFPFNDAWRQPNPVRRYSFQRIASNNFSMLSTPVATTSPATSQAGPPGPERTRTCNGASAVSLNPARRSARSVQKSAVPSPERPIGLPGARWSRKVPASLSNTTSSSANAASKVPFNTRSSGVP